MIATKSPLSVVKVASWLQGFEMYLVSAEILGRNIVPKFGAEIVGRNCGPNFWAIILGRDFGRKFWAKFCNWGDFGLGKEATLAMSSAMASQGQPLPAMVGQWFGHGHPWPATARHGWPLVRLGQP